MSYDWFLYMGPQFVWGRKLVNNLDFLRFQKKVGDLYEYLIPDEVTNMDRKYESFAYDLKNIEPVDNFDLIYLQEFCETGAWFEIKNGHVSVHNVTIKPMKGGVVYEC